MADQENNKESVSNADKANKLAKESVAIRTQYAIATRNILELEEKIAKLQENEAENLDEIIKLLERKEKFEEQASILEDRSNKNLKETVKLHQNQEKSLKETVKLHQDQEKSLKGSLGIDKSRELVNKRLLQKIEDTKESFERTEDLAQNILSTDKLREEAQKRVSLAIEESTGRMAMFSKLSMDETNNKEVLTKVYNTINTAAYRSVELESEAAEASKSASEGKLQLLDISKLISAKKLLENKLEQEGNNLTEEAKSAIKDELDLLGSKIDIFAKANDMSREAVKTYESQRDRIETVNSLLGGSFSKMGSLISKVPGGDFLKKHLGFDKMSDSIKKNMGGALDNVITGFKTGGVDGIKQMITGVQMFGKALLSGPQVAIFGIIAAVGMLVGLFMDLDAGISETQKELGGTKKEALAAHEAAHDMAKEMNLVGINAKEVVKGMATVSEIMGGIDVKNMMTAPGMKDMVKDATLLSDKFGLSKEEIENVHSLSIMSGKSMGDLAGEAIQVAGGVMKTKDAVKLLGGISKDVAVAFRGSTKELIAAAAKAKLLGMDLKKVKDIGMGMLDIESSLEKEMEARAILGRDINLDAAREAALKGDVATLQDELLKQAGSLDEFQKGGPLKQKALADAMGMSVEEMTNMLTKAEEMNKLGLDRQLQEKLANATAAEKAEIYKTQAATLSGEARDLALRKAAEEESASTAEKFGDIMTKIKETAMKLVAPILDVVHGLMDGIAQGGGLMDVFDGIMSALKPIMEIVTGISKLIFQGLFFPFKLVMAVIGPIFDAVKEIFSAFSSGEKDAGGIASIFETLSGVMSSIEGVITDVVKTFVTGLIEPSKVFYKAIITPLWGAFKGIFDTIKEAFAPLTKAKDEGEKTVGIVDMIKKAFEYITPVISFIGEVIAKVIVKPFELLGGLISSVVKIFTGDFQGGLKSLGDTVFNFFLGIPKMILTGIGGAIDSIFGTNIKGSITDLFAWIQKGFQTVYGLIEPIVGYIKKIGGFIIDYLMQPFKSVYGIIEGIGKIFSGNLIGGLEQIGKSILDYFLAPIKLIQNVFGAIVDFITKDLIGAIGNMVPGWLKKGIDWVLGGGGDEKKAAEETKSSGGGAKVELPKMATGGSVEKGGLAVVGENGPEMVSLPAGASVASTGASDQAASILKTMGFNTDETVGGAKTEKQSTGGGGVVSSIAEGIGGLFGSVVGGAVGAVTGGGGGGANMGNVEKKLDTLITLFTQAANQPTVIKFGDKTIEEFKTQLNFKKAYNIATDNTYGRAVD